MKNKIRESFAPVSNYPVCMLRAISKFRSLIPVVGAFLFLVATSRSLQAQPFILSQATDLADINFGQDLWRYTYQVGGYNFQTGQGFTLSFDSQLYGTLSNPQPDPSPSWSMIVVQRDQILQLDGLFDGQALQNSPSLAGTFQVDFVWLGQGTPGTQPFEIYNSDFSTAASGVTVVPEPQALTFISFGVLCGFTRFKSRPKNASPTSKHEAPII